MRIPRDPRWCSYCRTTGDCDLHRGPGAERIAYTGPDAYDPSPWVLEVVGKFYSSANWQQSASAPWELSLFICDGYDPRHGFWMKDLRTGEQRNISERAIGRTFHAIRDYSPGYREAVGLHAKNQP